MNISKKSFPIIILGALGIIICSYITYKTFISKGNINSHEKTPESKMVFSATDNEQSDYINQINDFINISKLGNSFLFSDVYNKEAENTTKLKIFSGDSGKEYEIDDKDNINKFINIINKAYFMKCKTQKASSGYTYTLSLFENSNNTDYLTITIGRGKFSKFSSNNLKEESAYYEIENYEEIRTELDNLFTSLTSTPSNNSEETNPVEDNCNEGIDAKPVIYLYPASEQNINVNLNYKGKLTCTYPEYKEGWKVTAKPDGTLTNLSDNREYSYLFWEGISDTKWDLSKGFVVKGSDTEKFLQEKLEYLGLTPKEYNEFIVYWLPIMQENKYNLITFAGEEYEDLAKLTITPKPDSILRVMMVFMPLDKPIEIEPQELKTFERKGFTVVEWGGTEVK